MPIENFQNNSEESQTHLRPGQNKLDQEPFKAFIQEYAAKLQIDEKILRTFIMKSGKLVVEILFQKMGYDYTNLSADIIRKEINFTQIALYVKSTVRGKEYYELSKLLTEFNEQIPPLAWLYIGSENGGIKIDGTPANDYVCPPKLSVWIKSIGGESLINLSNASVLDPCGLATETIARPGASATQRYYDKLTSADLIKD